MRKATGPVREGEVLAVSSGWWNGLVDRWFRDRVRSVRSVAGEPWRHPWWSRLAWDGARERWTVATRPGYCVRVPHRSGSPVVVVPGRSLAVPAGLDAPQGDVPLTDALGGEPLALAIPPGLWRRVGTDADPLGPAEAVPPFFRDLGVQAAGVTVTDPLTGLRTSQVGAAVDGARARLLRACDLVLRVDRPAARLDWSTGDGPVSGTGTLRAAVTVGSAPGARGSAWLRVRRAAVDEEAAAFASADSRALLALGGLVQPSWDELRLATLYLVSPPGARPGSAPDGTWQPHVRHEVHWNLQHVTRISLGDRAPEPVTFPLPLGAGSGQALVNAITATVNDQAALLSALVAGVRVEGRFFTMG